MFTISVTPPSVLPQGITENMISKLSNNTQLMSVIAEILISRTEENFKSQSDGSQPWDPLKPATIKRRAKKGHWPGPILQVSGRLAGSIQPVARHNFAGVSTNTIYAATHQLGSQRSRVTKKGITSSWLIPARPFFSITTQDTEAIKNTIAQYFTKK